MDLSVDDTTCFRSIGTMNPALTAMASALRFGDHLLEPLGVDAAPQEAARAT